MQPLALFCKSGQQSPLHAVQVAVTKAWPRPQGQIISEFESREDLIESLLTSCHIPWW